MRGTSAVRATLASSRTALRRVPAWLIVIGTFSLLPIVVLGVKLAGGDYELARPVAAGTTLAFMVGILALRWKDGWGIYGTLWFVGLGTGLLPLSSEWRVAIQIGVSVLLVYLFFDRGWLSDDEDADFSPAGRAGVSLAVA